MKLGVVLASIGVGSGLLACRHATRVDPGPSPLDDALFAQVNGLGGCDDRPTVVDTSSAYFPDVIFHVGRCTREHGDTGVALAATDGTGVLYQLGSRNGLAFFQLRHPARDLADTSVQRYALFVLKLAGDLAWEADIVTNVTAAVQRFKSNAWAIVGAPNCRLPTARTTVAGMARRGWRIGFVTGTEWRIVESDVVISREGRLVAVSAEIHCQHHAGDS